MLLEYKTITGIKWTTLSTIVLTFFGIIKISLLVRFIEAADFGLMALITVILGFMDLFMDMGFTTAILHNQGISKNEYASLYWMNILFSFILVALIYLASTYIGIFYNETELSLLLPIMSVSIILSAVGRQFKTIKQKQLKFKFIALTEISSAAIGFLVSILTAINGLGVYALIYGALVQYSISNSIYLINGLRSTGLIFRIKYNETKPFLRIGIYQVGGQLVNYFNRDLDILLVGKFFGPEILGGYSLAKQLVQRPMQIINPIISNVASPVLAILQKDKQILRKKFLSFLNVIATINLGAYIFLAALAYPVVFVMYGRDHLEIVPTVQVLSAYMFLRSIGSPVGSLITATGRTDIDLYWNLFVLLVTPIAVYIGAQYSVEYVGFCLFIASLILLYPFWKFVIFRLCSASRSEFFLSIFVPRVHRIVKLAIGNTRNHKRRG